VAGIQFLIEYGPRGLRSAGREIDDVDDEAGLLGRTRLGRADLLRQLQLGLQVEGELGVGADDGDVGLGHRD
jgi:hypothetical protein